MSAVVRLPMLESHGLRPALHVAGDLGLDERWERKSGVVKRTLQRNQLTMGTTFRHSAGFGKRIEYYIVGLMLKEGLDVYLPLVDDDAIDAVVKRPIGGFVEVQIKARSNTASLGDGALFAAITHEHRPNYWFVFYSERLTTMWIMSSQEFIAEAAQNKKGVNVGKRSIWFNGTKTNKDSKKREEYIKERYQKYVANDFARLLT